MIKKWFWTILDIILVIICVYRLRVGGLSTSMFIFNIVLIMTSIPYIYYIWAEYDKKDDFIS